MSFHELLASYPWLTKRVARVSPEFPQDKMPRRNIFACLLCLIIPRPSVATLLVIYGLILGGTLKGQELIKNAEARHNAAAFSTLQQLQQQQTQPDDGSMDNQGPVIQGAPVMPGVPDSGYSK